MKRRSSSSHRNRGQVRIIGGTWRSRRLPVIQDGTVRPSSDRVRETLFNWLMPVLPGARCLDLFAGTGALAFEAVSRGAESALMVDVEPSHCRQLVDNIDVFQSDRLSVRCTDALELLAAADKQRYDVVFLDPPFDGDLLAKALSSLEGWLNEGAVIYVEHHQALDDIELPPGFVWQKKTRIGKLFIGLASNAPA